MAELLHSFITGLNFVFIFAGSGALFAAGFAAACRWLKWAPVNITVNVHNHPTPRGGE